ncbi:MAG: type II/IV secretion system ATPase subunit [Candidatus Thermoplasmatota archaeon]
MGLLSASKIAIKFKHRNTDFNAKSPLKNFQSRSLFEPATEISNTKLIIKCKECSYYTDNNAELGSNCIKCILQQLSEKHNIERIVLAHYIEREYFGASVKVLKSLATLKSELYRFSLCSKSTKKCTKCYFNPQKFFSFLAELLNEDFHKFWNFVVSKLRDREFLGEDFTSNSMSRSLSNLKSEFSCVEDCTVCRLNTLKNLEWIAKKFEVIGKAIKLEAYRVIEESQEKFDFAVLEKGISRILAYNQLYKPSFSPFWLDTALPSDLELIAEYQLNGSKVALYSNTNETEDFYHVMPLEYELPLDYIKLIELAKSELSSEVPNCELSFENARNYIEKSGIELIYKLAKELNIKLGNSEGEALENAKKLAAILAKYVAGLGILEIFLDDLSVQDVYIDAPVEESRIYLVLNNSNSKLRNKFQTNIRLIYSEAESLLSRFRATAGRPFSETFPVLECDLGSYEARITALGKPLSPRGLAFAVRRHSSEPWNLLRLIHNKTISSIGAALLSFLIDARCAILVAGSRGSGKTSLLTALVFEFPTSTRILTIEDTLELPVAKLKMLGYKVQSLLTRGAIAQTSELDADKALKVALRLGESAIVIGEVRGNEAKTLYESMRTGTAGSSVLGTIHGNDAKTVFQRVVYDLGISPYSFSATDIVVVMGLIRPHGSYRYLRRVVQIAELSKQEPEKGEFYDLMVYDFDKDELVATEYFKKSEKLNELAKLWGMSSEQAFQNINARAEIRKILVDYAERTKNEQLLAPKWVVASNNKFWNLIENNFGNKIDYSKLVKEWEDWFKGNVEYV